MSVAPANLARSRTRDSTIFDTAACEFVIDSSHSWTSCGRTSPTATSPHLGRTWRRHAPSNWAREPEVIFPFATLVSAHGTHHASCACATVGVGLSAECSTRLSASVSSACLRVPCTVSDTRL